MTDTVEAASPQTAERSGLDAMLLPELKKLGASLGVKGTGAMRKGALIDAIKSAQRGGSAQSEAAPRKRASKPAAEQSNEQPTLTEAPATPPTAAPSGASADVDDVASRLEALKAGDKGGQRGRRHDSGEGGSAPRNNEQRNNEQRSNEQRGNEQA